MTHDDEAVETPEPDFFVACVVLRDRAYGGPEEGGWWYDTEEPQIGAGFPLPRVTRTREEAKEACNDMRAWCAESNRGRPSINSVLSEGMFGTAIYEGEWPKALPEERPRYE